MNGEARHRYISKLYMYPMNDLVDLANAGVDSDTVLKRMGHYKVYSGHDSQIANILYQFNPSYNFTYIKYASQIYFEVYREKLEESNYNFYVRPVYNGQVFPIEGC